MSDTPEGPDWWLGVDGKWYPPVAAASTGEPGRPRRIAKVPLVIGAVAIVVVGAIAVGAVLLFGGGDDREDRYLAALDEAGLDEWVTDRAAINAGYAVCERLDGGGPTRGSATDLVAVEHLCPDYVDAFRALETADVDGTFTVNDRSDFGGEPAGTSCQPSGGYGDVNASTQVVARNPAGDELARTSLGPGENDGAIGCEFTFELALTEGESVYIVEVGDRGEISYSWDEISRPGAIALTLGD